MSLKKNGPPSIYFDILSPISGTVTRRNVAIGDYVNEGTDLFEVVDLRKVWVVFDAYEADLPWISIGDRVAFSVNSFPGKTYYGTVSFIDPFIHPDNRVARVRVDVDNSNFHLKPEMFVNGMLKSTLALNTESLLIPKTAVPWTGKRSIVYVKVPERKPPTFTYRIITLGPESGDYYVVEDGLSEGEEIVRNGVFKIDASAQLLGKNSMMGPGDARNNTEYRMDTDNGFRSSVDRQNEEDAVNDEFKKQLGTLLIGYDNMKNAFVLSDRKRIVSNATAFLKMLNKVDMGLLTGTKHDDWMALWEQISDNVNGIINMKGLEMKRGHFSIVSDRLVEAIERFGIISDSTIYLEFCPMAFDNKGACWISFDKEIKNPYFGAKMLTCGEVKKIIR